MTEAPIKNNIPHVCPFSQTADVRCAIIIGAWHAGHFSPMFTRPVNALPCSGRFPFSEITNNGRLSFVARDCASWISRDCGFDMSDAKDVSLTAKNLSASEPKRGISGCTHAIFPQHSLEIWSENELKQASTTQSVSCTIDSSFATPNSLNDCAAFASTDSMVVCI